MNAKPIEIPCTIEIEQTAEYFHAHLTFDVDVDIGPGDRVQVHGDPIHVAFGQTLREHRRATVLRAGILRRLWIYAVARFSLQELYEVSFTHARTL